MAAVTPTTDTSVEEKEGASELLFSLNYTVTTLIYQLYQRRATAYHRGDI
jgi:hypothetical protein